MSCGSANGRRSILQIFTSIDMLFFFVGYKYCIISYFHTSYFIHEFFIIFIIIIIIIIIKQQYKQQ